MFGRKIHSCMKRYKILSQQSEDCTESLTKVNFYKYENKMYSIIQNQETIICLCY